MIFLAEVLQNLQQGIPCLSQGENSDFDYFHFFAWTGVEITV